MSLSHPAAGRRFAPACCLISSQQELQAAWDCVINQSTKGLHYAPLIVLVCSRPHPVTNSIPFWSLLLQQVVLPRCGKAGWSQGVMCKQYS